MIVRMMLALALLAGATSTAMAQDAPPAGAKEQISALKESVYGQERPSPGLGAIGADESGFSSSMYKMLKGLGLCLGVLLVGAHFVRKATGHQGAARSERRLKLLERLPISSKSSLVLVELEGKTLLVAVGSDNVSFCPAAPSPGLEFSDSLDAVSEEKLEAIS